VWGTPIILYVAWWIAYHEPTNARQNLTAAPAYGAELAANALRGLFGLDSAWGRPLLIAAVILVGLRLAKRALTPRILGLLLTATAFWISIGLGRAQLGDPDAPRYIYAGAVLIVLILAETFRGFRFTGRGVVLASLIALFAVAGNLRALGTGENFLRLASRQVSSELTALELARPTASPAFKIDPHYAPQIIAGLYFQAIDAIGSSPAYSVAQVLRAPEGARTAADDVFIRAGEVRARVAGTGPAAATVAPDIEHAVVGSVHARGGCVQFRPAGLGAALDLGLPAGGLEIHAAAGPAVAVRVRRFAAGYEGGPIVSLNGGQTAVVRRTADSSSLPWHVRVSPRQPVMVCGLG
jgi:hypothetical protein